MNVIRHNNVAPDSPSMPAMSCAPFIDQNVCDLIESKELPSIFRAHCDKIDWRFDPDALEPPQMLVRSMVAAEGADLGNLRCNRPHIQPRSTLAATTSVACSRYKQKRQPQFGTASL